MRTIKASEVVKGMRVRVEQPWGPETTQVTEGPVMVSANPYHAEYVELELDGVTIGIAGDHPVTVIAEPEPEWVEGAWYRCQIGENEPENLRRLPHGWTPFHDTDHVFHADGDNEAQMLTVLGRVLIVDWPGDDVARELDAINDGNRSTSLSNYGRTTTHDTILRNVADAIRTQGGAP